MERQTEASANLISEREKHETYERTEREGYDKG